MRFGELGNLRSDLISDAAPLGACCLWRLLGERRGDEGGHDTPSALSGMGQGIPHEVNPATLPGRIQHLADRNLDALIGIGDDELHVSQTTAGQFGRL